MVVVKLSQQKRKELLEFAAKRPSAAVISGYAEDIGWLEVGDSRPVSLVLDREGVLKDFIFGSSDAAGFERMVRPYL